MSFFCFMLRQIYDKDLCTGFIKYCGIKNKQKKDFTEVKPLLMDLFDCMFCDPHGARTHDPNIKSVVLYQLS